MQAVAAALGMAAIESVIADEDLAMKLAISGVPALLIHHNNEPLEQATEVSGAQPFEYVRAVLEDSLAASLPNCGFTTPGHKL
jgi:predicted DsbA family dithiol-disulfide isomerase